MKKILILAALISTSAFAYSEKEKNRMPQQEVIGQIGKIIKGTFGDLTCYAEVDDTTGTKSKYAITVTFSQLLVSAIIKLENIDASGKKTLYRGRDPRLVKMNDAQNKWSTKEEYYVSDDDYVDLTIHVDEKTKKIAAVYNMPFNGFYEFECKKVK